MFGYVQDKKKASGRALGTLVEIVTFYTLCAWELRDHIVIERSVSEFVHPEITHNVEFSLHPIASTHSVTRKPLHLPVTSAKVLRALGQPLTGVNGRQETLVTTRRVMRNAAIVAEREGGFVSAHLIEMDAKGCAVALTDLFNEPFAVFECKRVGVEEGMRKGPQTIEKAKQGAYVARSVSSLQSVRSFTTCRPALGPQMRKESGFFSIPGKDLIPTNTKIVHGVEWPGDLDFGGPRISDPRFLGLQAGPRARRPGTAHAELRQDAAVRESRR